MWLFFKCVFFLLTGDSKLPSNFDIFFFFIGLRNYIVLTSLDIQPSPGCRQDGAETSLAGIWNLRLSELKHALLKPFQRKKQTVIILTVNLFPLTTVIFQPLTQSIRIGVFCYGEKWLCVVMQQLILVTCQLLGKSCFEMLLTGAKLFSLWISSFTLII